MSRILKSKIQKKQARIAVMGLGYVGLPLAVSFAKAGFNVIGLDTDQDRINRLNQGKSYIVDVPSKVLASVVHARRLIASSCFDQLAHADVILICVPTPLKRRYTPDITFIVNSVKAIEKYLRKNTLVVLESTTYPGTTEELIKPMLEKSGLRIGKDFFLAFSPERIDPGNKTYDVTSIPKVVGGVTLEGGELTRLLYSKIIKHVHLVSSAKAAEMTKLLENSFRIINIGWINEVAMMCHKMGVDVWEIIDAAKTKPFGFMPFYPGLGVGGHCIPDDPLYLYWKARHHGFSSKYIKLSADTNHAMPGYVAGRLAEMLAKRHKKLKGARLLVVGVTYKKDVKDLRKSPPLALIELLEKKKCVVDYHDPLIPFLKIGTLDKLSVKLTPRALQGYDCVVVATDHTRVNYKSILRHARAIYDIRNIYKDVLNKKVERF